MGYVLIEQQNGGCDYTIGCGIRVTKLKAADMAGAIAEAVDRVGDDWQARHEHGIASAELLEVVTATDLSATLNAASRKRAQEQEERKAKAQDEAEMAEFERLRKRFGQ